MLRIESADPSKRGHQAAKDLLYPVSLFLRLHEIILQPWFFVFPHFISSKGLIFHFVSNFNAHGLMVNGLGPTNRPTYQQPGGAQDPGWPQNHPEKPSNLKPFSRATKVMKTGPKATQVHEEWTLESREIQFLRKLILAMCPLPNAWFSNPRHPDSYPKIIRKSNLEIRMKSALFVGPKVLKKFFKWIP